MSTRGESQIRVLEELSVEGESVVIPDWTRLSQRTGGLSLYCKDQGLSVVRLKDNGCTVVNTGRNPTIKSTFARGVTKA